MRAPIRSAARRLSLAVDLRPRVQRFDLAQLLQQRPFERQHALHNKSRPPFGVTTQPTCAGLAQAARRTPLLDGLQRRRYA